MAHRSALDPWRLHGMTGHDPAASDSLSLGALLWFGGGLLLTLLGELVAIHFQPPSVALGTIFWYAFVFALLAWRRTSVAVLGLLVALPLITVEVGLGDVEKTFSTDKLALGAVALVWLARRAVAADRRRLFQPPVTRWWGLFLGVVLVSALVNGRFLDEGWGVVKQVIYACVFLASLDAFSEEPGLLKRALAGAGLAGSLVALLALVEWVGRSRGAQLFLYFKQGTIADAYSAGSTFAHVNFLSGYLVLVLPILIAIAAGVGRKWRPLAVAGAVSVVLALFYASSVGAWVGLTAAGLLVAALVRGALPRQARALVVAACVGAVIVTAGVAVRKLPSSSVSVRFVAYRIGLAAIAERPVLGFGARGYTRESARIERELYGRMQDFHTPKEPLSAHSSFLDIAVERGLIGAGAFVGVVASVLLAGARAFRRLADPRRRVLLLGMLAGLSAFSLQAFTENLFSYSKVAGIFWIVAGAMVALARGAPDGGKA
jgi:O-antigen ligase